MTNSDRPRRPAWVYAGGSDPDYRFSLANERTYLAWLRTAAALIAGGVGVDVVLGPESGRPATIVALVLVLIGTSLAVLAAARWARAERAMRRSEPLPGSGSIAVVTVGLVVVCSCLVVLIW